MERYPGYNMASKLAEENPEYKSFASKYAYIGDYFKPGSALSLYLPDFM